MRNCLTSAVYAYMAMEKLKPKQVSFHCISLVLLNQWHKCDCTEITCCRWYSCYGYSVYWQSWSFWLFWFHVEVKMLQEEKSCVVHISYCAPF